jgi:hypothetical protein
MLGLPGFQEINGAFQGVILSMTGRQGLRRFTLSFAHGDRQPSQRIELLVY